MLCLSVLLQSPALSECSKQQHATSTTKWLETRKWCHKIFLFLFASLNFLIKVDFYYRLDVINILQCDFLLLALCLSPPKWLSMSTSSSVRCRSMRKRGFCIGLSHSPNRPAANIVLLNASLFCAMANSIPVSSCTHTPWTLWMNSLASNDGTKNVSV